jgi:hypothetical protein
VARSCAQELRTSSYGPSDGKSEWRVRRALFEVVDESIGQCKGAGALFSSSAQFCVFVEYVHHLPSASKGGAWRGRVARACRRPHAWQQACTRGVQAGTPERFRVRKDALPVYLLSMCTRCERR